MIVILITLSHFRLQFQAGRIHHQRDDARLIAWWRRVGPAVDVLGVLHEDEGKGRHIAT